MTRIIALILSLCLILCVLPLGIGATQPDESLPPVYTMTEVASGAATPTAECTVTISTVEELLAFAAYVNNGNPTAGICFRQEATITLNKGKFNTDGRWYELDGSTQIKDDPTALSPIGLTEGEPIAFLGTWDGNGYHINGLYINTEAEAVGLFALLGPGAVVRRLSLRNSFVGGSATLIGAVAAQAIGTPEEPVLIDQCINRGHVNGKGASAAGIVGRASYATVANCTNEGWITGTERAGGIIALADTGTELYTSMNLQVARCGGITGGIAAELKSNTVLQNCLNTAHLAGDQVKGGIVGIAAEGATVQGCYYRDEVATRGIGSVEENDAAATAPKTDTQLKSTAFVIELNTFHLTSTRIRDLCHPWQRGSEHPLIGSTPTAVIVTDGTSTFGAGCLQDAATMCGEGATVRLFSHIEDAGGDISGIYTLDLNGYTVTLRAPLQIKGGTITLTDTAPTDVPAGKLLAVESDAVVLKGGSLMVEAVGLISSETAYAIRCEGIGRLKLPTNPQLLGAGADLYLRYAGILEGGGSAPSGDTEYVGAGIVTVDCGWQISEGDTVAKNATLAEYEFRTLTDGFAVEEQNGHLIAVRAASPVSLPLLITGIIVATLLLAAAGLLLRKKLRKTAKK